MDPSTEYKKHRVDKSSETPWSPEHERRRLRERAGTIYRRSQYSIQGAAVHHDEKSWSGNKKKVKRFERLTREKSFIRPKIIAGKNVRTGRPAGKKPGEESEY